MQRRIISLASRIVLILTASLLAGPVQAEDLFQLARDAHRSSRAMIQTCSCRVHFKSETSSGRAGPSSGESSGQFWYSPDAVRGQVAEFGTEIDFLWKGGLRQAVLKRSENGQSLVSATRDRVPSPYIERCDAWVRGLMAFQVPNTRATLEFVPFEDLAARASQVKKAEKRRFEGLELIAIQLLFEKASDKDLKWEIEVYFDPAVNYLVRRTVYKASQPDGDFVREEVVSQFKECTRGVFFPERAQGHSGRAGHPDFHHTTVISQIQVNKPHPNDAFQLRYPYNVYMTDTVRWVRYQVDTDGKQISTATPLDRSPPPPPLAEPGSSPGTETQQEPASITRWIFPIALSVLGLAALAFFARRWRKG